MILKRFFCLYFSRSVTPFFSVCLVLSPSEVIIEPKECRDTFADGNDYTALHIPFHTNISREVRGVSLLIQLITFLLTEFPKLVNYDLI